MKSRKLGLGLLAVGILMLAPVSPAKAAGSCNGPSTTPRTGVVYVSAGSNCVLGASDSPSYIAVASGGTLKLEGVKATRVVAMGAVTIANSIISDSVFLNGISNGPSRLCGSIIGGYLVISSNSSAVAVAPTDACPISNFVAAGVYAAANTGPVEFHALSIFGPLYCYGNSRAPQVGAVTTLPPGQFFGQCAR